MRFLGVIFLSVFLFACGGSGSSDDSDPVPDTDTETETDPVPETESTSVTFEGGVWFPCEAGEDVLSCSEFDEKGFVFAADGTVKRVQLNTDLCPVSSLGVCFSETETEITTRTLSFGTFTSDESSLDITLSDGNQDCELSASVELTEVDDVVKLTYSGIACAGTGIIDTPEGEVVYMGRYSGTNTILDFVALGENAALLGTWTGVETTTSGATSSVWTLEVTNTEISYEERIDDVLGESYSATYTLNTSPTLKEIDYVLTEYVDSSYVGLISKGLYKLEMGTLTFVNNLPGEGTRPTDFTPNNIGTIRLYDFNQ